MSKNLSVTSSKKGCAAEFEGPREWRLRIRKAFCLVFSIVDESVNISVRHSWWIEIFRPDPEDVGSVPSIKGSWCRLDAGLQTVEEFERQNKLIKILFCEIFSYIRKKLIIQLTFNHHQQSYNTVTRGFWLFIWQYRCEMSDVSFGARLTLRTLLCATVISGEWINLRYTMDIKTGDKSSLAITFQRSRVTVFNRVKSFIKPLLVDRNNYLEREVNE